MTNYKSTIVRIFIPYKTSQSHDASNALPFQFFYGTYNFLLFYEQVQRVEHKHDYETKTQLYI